MNPFSLVGFASHLYSLGVKWEVHKYHALKKAAKIVEAEAKREIGHQQGQAGPFVAWAPLASTTINGFAGHPGKASMGHSPPDYDPLYRTGDMRDSIQHTVIHDEAHVGSNSQVAVEQELGTLAIPPRSFLGGAAVRKRNDVGKAIGQDAYMVLTGHAVASEVDIP